MLTVPPVDLIFLSHGLNPGLVTFNEWSPRASSISEGVLPTKLPSTSISAALGLDAMENLAVCALDTAGDVADAADAADAGGWVVVPAVNGLTGAVPDVAFTSA